MLGELQPNGRILICDLEAGVGTLQRLSPRIADVVLVVVEPSLKSIEVARRVIELAVTRELDTVLVANQVGSGQDIRLIEAGLGRPPDWVVPYDPVVVLAERDGRAPIDLDGVSSAVGELSRLADHLGSAEQELYDPDT